MVCIDRSCSFGCYAHLLAWLGTFACMMHCTIHFCMWACVLDADFRLTHHILDVMIDLGLHFSDSTCMCAPFWFLILRLHFLNFVLRGFTFERKPHVTLKGTRPLYHEHVSWHDPSHGWSGRDCSLATCPLSWLWTLWIALSICNIYSWLLTCLIAHIGWPWILWRLYPFRGSLRSVQRVQDPFTTSVHHGFWSSGLCMMHLDKPWSRS